MSAVSSSQPKVVHCRRAPSGSFVYVGRPSVFGNPFPLEDPTDDTARDQVIRHYHDWFHQRVATDSVFRQAVLALRGRDLGCWCAPRRCHAEVILAWLAAARS
jgi:hypothetical protein